VSTHGNSGERASALVLRVRFLAGVGRLYRTGERGQALVRGHVKPSAPAHERACGWCREPVAFAEPHVCYAMRVDLRHALVLVLGAERVALLSDPTCEAVAEHLPQTEVDDANALAIASAELKRTRASIEKARALNLLPETTP